MIISTWQIKIVNYFTEDGQSEKITWLQWKTKWELSLLSHTVLITERDEKLKYCRIFIHIHILKYCLEYLSDRSTQNGSSARAETSTIVAPEPRTARGSMKIPWINEWNQLSFCSNQMQKNSRKNGCMYVSMKWNMHIGVSGDT